MSNKIKILLVDDSPSQRFMVQTWLEQEGYFVEVKNDGVEALNHLQNSTDLPYVILSDIIMPNMDGFEFCAEVNKAYPNIPFIMLTVHTKKENIQKAFASGAADYIGKPFSKAELLVRVSNLFNRQDAEELLSNKISELRSRQAELEEQNKKLQNIEAESIKVDKSFKNVFNNATDAMLILSENSFIDCNDVTVKLLNAKSKKDILSTHPCELSPKTQPDGRDSSEKADEMIKIAFENGFHRFEWMHRKITGEDFPVEVSLTPIGYKNELMLHTLWRDLTEQKKHDKQLDLVNKELMQSNAKLEKANQTIRKKAKTIEDAAKTKSSFLTTMSHEIRTPLNAIMGSARLLKESESPEETKQYTDIIETSGNLLLGIVNNVLDYSRIEAHMLTILSNQFSLDSIINSLKEILEKTAESKKLKFEVQSDFDLSVELIGDDIRLQQIILNLCNNAIKYTKAGGIVLKIEKLTESETSVRYKFSVIDTGIGVSKEDMKLLFKPFSQFNPEENKDVEGTGLGLSIVKSTVDLMEGKVGVESEPGIGSVFWTELEFKKQETKKVDRRRSPKQRLKYTKIKKKLKILIVDDYKFSRIILEKNLKKLGLCSIDIAVNGQEAVDLFKLNNYDIIFMDCQMPVLNGFKATKEIRKVNKRNKNYTHIIALSADVMTENKEVCINAGMDYFMVKPFNPEKINDILREVIIKKLIN